MLQAEHQMLQITKTFGDRKESNCLSLTLQKEDYEEKATGSKKTVNLLSFNRKNDGK